MAPRKLEVREEDEGKSDRELETLRTEVRQNREEVSAVKLQISELEAMIQKKFEEVLTIAALAKSPREADRRAGLRPEEETAAMAGSTTGKYLAGGSGEDGIDDDWLAPEPREDNRRRLTEGRSDGRRQELTWERRSSDVRGRGPRGTFDPHETVVRRRPHEEHRRRPEREEEFEFGEIRVRRGVGMDDGFNEGVGPYGVEPWGRGPIGLERGNGLEGNMAGTNKWVRKLEMPIFKGEDVVGWILRAERYFLMTGFTEEDKLREVALTLEGTALAWYHWQEQRMPFESWGEFKEKLIKRFGTIRDRDLGEQFLALTREGKVKEYREKFEELAGRIRGIPEYLMCGNFMKGLKPEIQNAVRVGRPQGLEETMDLALLVDEQISTERQRVNHGVFFGGTNRTGGLTSNFPAQLVGLPRETWNEPSGDVQPNSTFRRLTDTEYQAKRAKGLCFRCNEKFAPGHRCKDRALQVLLAYDEEMDEEDEARDTGDKEDHLHLDVAQVSLNSVAGLTSTHTMKLWGNIGVQKMLILIDSGATHNFISTRVVSQLGLQLFDIENFGVVMGTGQVEHG